MKNANAIANNASFSATWEELQVKMQSLLSDAHHGSASDVIHRIELVEIAVAHLKGIAKAELNQTNCQMCPGMGRA